MSHVTKSKCPIEAVNADMFCRAVTSTAQDFNLEIGYFVRDYVGKNETPCTISILGGDIPNGIGFNFAHGSQVETVGDNWGAKVAPLWKNIEDRCFQYYNALQAQRAMQNNGYAVDITMSKEGKVKLTCTQY